MHRQGKRDLMPASVDLPMLFYNDYKEKLTTIKKNIKENVVCVVHSDVHSRIADPDMGR